MDTEGCKIPFHVSWELTAFYGNTMTLVSQSNLKNVKHFSILTSHGRFPVISIRIPEMIHLCAVTRLLQHVSCRNMRRLHLSLPVGEFRGMSHVHPERLPPHRGSLQGGTNGLWSPSILIIFPFLLVLHCIHPFFPFHYELFLVKIEQGSVIIVLFAPKFKGSPALDVTISRFTVLFKTCNIL